MPIEILEQKIKKLPEKYLDELSDYVTYLEYKAKNRETNKKPKRTPGGLTGHFWMAEDFDETPECFKDYV